MDINAVNELIRNIELSSSGPIQGTEEWLSIRSIGGNRQRGRIGGSEIAALIGDNPYKRPKDLMEVKLGRKKDKMPDRIHCWFGLMFEEVAVKLFEQRYNTSIMCKNISLVDHKLPFSIFSPDGLCAIPLCPDTGKVLMDFNLYNNADIDMSNMKYVPILIEIKCPLSRDLTRNAKVPTYYVPQLQKGMLCIEEAHASIFIDNCFRLCAYKDLHTSKAYNTRLHRLDKAIDNDQEEIDYGCILFYGQLPKDVDTRYIERIRISNGNIVSDTDSFSLSDDDDVNDVNDVNDNTTTEVYDFGGSSYTTVLNILKELRSNIYTVEYMDPNDTYIYPDPKRNLLGILCWKLFESTYTLVYRDEIVIDKIVKSMHKYANGEYDVLVTNESRTKVTKKKATTNTSDNDSFSLSE